jgi:hypothetical protein
MAEHTPDMVAELPTKWAAYLRDQPESGMSYQLITLVLNDGRRFERVPCRGGYIDLTGLPGFWKVPFAPTDVVEVIVTHDRSGPPRLVV